MEERSGHLNMGVMLNDWTDAQCVNFVRIIRSL